jgi:hypothetical protein
VPIIIVCPECDSELELPDTLAGRKIECPECSTHLRVPGDKRKSPEPVEEPSPSEEPEFERPKTKRPRAVNSRSRRTRRQKAAGSGNLLLVGIPIAVVALFGVAFAVILLTKSKSNTNNAGGVARSDGTTPDRTSGSPSGSSTSGRTLLDPAPLATPKRPPLPEGWVDFRHPSGAYSVYLPGKAQLVQKTNGKPPPNLPIGNGAYGEEMYAAESTGPSSIQCGISTIAGPPESLPAHVTASPNHNSNLFPGVKWTVTQFSWYGNQAIEYVTEADLGGMVAAMPGGPKMQQAAQQAGMNTMPKKSVTYSRHVLVGNRVYVFSIHNWVQGEPSEADRRAFFDSVVFGR